MLALPVDCLGDFGPRGLSVQYTQDVRGCPPAHTGRPWPSVSTHRTSVAVRVCLCVSVSTHRTSVAVPHTHRTSVGVRQHTQDIRGYPCVSVCVRLCPSAHTGRSWLSISTHISTLVLGLSTLALPVDCLGNFGPRGLSVQYTQDVRGCLPAHTGRPWLSVSTHRTSVAVRVCPCVFVSTHRMSVGVRQHTKDVCGCPSAHKGRPWVSVSTHRTSVCVRQHAQDILGCPCVSVSTHRTSVGVHQYTYQHVGPWNQHAGPSRGVFGLFWPTWAVCSVNTGRPWVSASTHKTSVAVCACSLAHTGRPCVSVCARQDTQDVRGCPSVHISYTQDVRGCPSAHKGRPCVSVNTHKTFVASCPCVSVCVRVSPSVHTGRLWLSISTHISTLVPGLSTLTLPLDCMGAFGPRWLSVQYTQDVRGRDASTHRTYVAVRQRTQAVCGSPCVSVSTNMTSVAIHQYTYQHAVHIRCPWVSASTHRTSVDVRQHTQDVRGCLCVAVSTHKTSVAVHLYTYQHAGPLTQHAGPSRGLLGTHRTSVAVCVCPCVSVSTHRTSVAVHQYTYQHVGPWTQHADPSHRLFGTSVVVRVCPRVSVHVRQHTQNIRSCPSYTQDVGGCPPAHTGRPWLSVCVRQHAQDICGCPCVSVSTHMTSKGVHQYTYLHVVHTGRPWVSASTHRTSVAVRVCPSTRTGHLWLSVCVRQHTHDVRGCPSIHISERCKHRTSVGVHQHTQDVRGCLWLSVSTHRTSMAVRVCPWVSISTHISTLVLGISTLALPVDCLGDFGPRGLSVQYTQDVCGCPSAHTGRPCVSVNTHRMSVAVCVCPFVSVCLRQYTQDVCGCPSVNISALHTGRPWASASTHKTSVAVRQSIQDVRGSSCVSVSTNMTSVAVHQYTYQHAVHIRRPWVSASTHRTSVAIHQYTYQHAVHIRCPWVSASTHRTSVVVRQHTQDVRGCLCVAVSTHKTSVAVHLYTYQHAGPLTQHAGPSRGLLGTSVAVCVCPSAHTGRPWLSISTHISMLVLGLSTLTLPIDCSGDFGPRGPSVLYTHDVRGCPPAHTGRLWLSACVRVCPSMSVSTHRTSYTQDVRGCPPAHTGRPWLSVCVRQHAQDICGCPCVSVSTHMTSKGVHQYTYLHVVHTGRPWVSASTHRTSVAVRVCPSTRTGHLWLSVCVRQHTHDVRGCPSIHISERCKHRTSVGVHQHTQDVRGCLWLSVSTHRTSMAVRVCPWVSISTHISTLVLGISTLALPVDCLGDFGPRGLSVQYTQDVCGCPSAHTGRPCVSVNTHRMSVAVYVCPFVSVCLRQYTQDVCGCPSVNISALHTGRPWASASTHRTSMAVRQSIQDVRGSSCVSVSTNMTSYTYDVRGCPASTHRTSVVVRQHTQDIRGCPCVAVSTHKTSVAVHQYTYQHAGPLTQHAGPSRRLLG
ncbi:hypothetical protein YC2023_066117 [Brassica napus]